MSSGDTGSSRKNSRNFSTSLHNLHGLGRRDALVDVVQQLDLLAQFLAAGFEQLQGAADIAFALEHRGVMQRRNALGLAGTGAIAGHAGHAHLDADVAEAVRHMTLGLIDHFA